MKHFHPYLFIVIQSLSTGIAAQDYEPWQPIDTLRGGGLPGTFMYSENLDLAIYSGKMYREIGNQNQYLAGYNGNNWEVLADSVGSGFQNLVDYQNGILICTGSVTPIIGTQPVPHVAYYDGVTWSYPWVFNNSVSKLVWVNDTLHALGAFTEIDGVPAFNIARLVNGVWEGLVNPDIDLQFAIYGDMAYYNGQYYVAGNIQMFNNGPNDLVILEDGEFLPVGSGVSGSSTMLGPLEVYNDELYIGGRILVAEGNVGNHIIKWNGSEFSAVGDLLYFNQGEIDGFGGLSGQGLQVYDGALYVGGLFYFIGDQPIFSLARWDGVKWCGYPTDVFDQDNTSFLVFQDKIILHVLNQWFVDDYDNYNSIWILDDKDLTTFCTDPLSTNDLIKTDIAFKLFPNPGLSYVTIQCDKQIESIEIMDVSGRVVFIDKALPADGLIDITSLPAGIYLAHVAIVDGRLIAQKFIVK